METLDTEPSFNSLTAVDQTRNGFRVAATDIVSGEHSADIASTTKDATNPKIQPVMPVELATDASDRDEVVSLDDDLEIFTGMTLPMSLMWRVAGADKISKPICEADRARERKICSLAAEII